jgi:hypothetical protein
LATPTRHAGRQEFHFADVSILLLQKGYNQKSIRGNFPCALPEHRPEGLKAPAPPFLGGGYPAISLRKSGVLIKIYRESGAEDFKLRQARKIALSSIRGIETPALEHWDDRKMRTDSTNYPQTQQLPRVLHRAESRHVPANRVFVATGRA